MMDVPPKRLIRSSGRLARSHDFLGLLVARFRRVPEFETWMFARSWMQVPWGLFSLARLAPSHHAQIENSGFPYAGSRSGKCILRVSSHHGQASWRDWRWELGPAATRKKGAGMLMIDDMDPQVAPSPLHIPQLRRSLALGRLSTRSSYPCLLCANSPLGPR